MDWIILLAASVFEIGFAVCMGKLKSSHGHAFTWWMTGFSICLVLSVYLLYKATQTLPVGTAYAVWTGIGAVGIALLGMILFKEPATFWRLLFMTTLIASIVGLKLSS
jgi:quaternary ammonium compound-resistance protein SugE